MDLMDCGGCGFTFRTERGGPGNFYFGSSEMWWMIHECGYCETVTHIGDGVFLKVSKPGRKKDWRYAQ